MSGDRRCEHCGGPLGARDRVCFRCQRPAGPPAPASPAGQPASPFPAAQPPAPPQRPAAPAEPLRVELVWGRDRRMYVIPPSGLTIGSTAAADLVVPAAFLAPVHARISHQAGHWVAESLSAAGLLLVRGDLVRSAPVGPGDMFRLADRAGNFVTVRVPQEGRGRPREGAMRAPLPAPGDSYLIGSDAHCRVRLDHPLVQRRHVTVRRDTAGAVWLEDRGTTAGTYVNGQRLRGRLRVGPGDVLQVGPFSARIGERALEPLEQVPGIHIDVRDARVDTPAAGARPGRALLQHVSLDLAPATMTAVAGPSGAGKTTLMRLLSGLLAAAAGSVSYNGADLAGCRQAYAALMGYVPQEDIVHADLTVTEALGYQARLRLGPDSPEAVRAARVERVLSLLGLTGQAGQLVKTLSGGQRKRVSIACELLNEPQILFLDEPTSGLDPGLDKRMMLLLRLLADQGRTVVLTTRAIAHVDVCDMLVLVGPGGHVIYAGPPQQALDWFGVQTLGDIFSVVDSPEAAQQAAARLHAAGAAPEPRPPAHPAAPVAAPGSGLGGARPPVGSAAWRHAVAAQGRIFASRYIRLTGRDRAALAFSLLQGIAVALLTALAVPKPFSWLLNGNAPMFVFGCAAVWFGMISAVRELVKERAIWRREFLAGGSLPAYLGSKVAVLGALAAFQALTLTVAAGLTLGLPASSPLASPFVTIFGTLWLAILSGMALGLLVSAASATADRAMSLVPYLLITQLVLCGVLFRLGAMTFTSWFMPARWAVSALGGIAGLSASRLHQTSGLYPHSAGGLLGNWLMLALLTAAGIGVAVWLLDRQGRSWSVGSGSPSRGLLSGLRSADQATPAAPAATPWTPGS